MNYNNKFHIAQRDLFSRALRAMFALLKKCSRLNLPLDIGLDLFDKTVLPVMTYGCEVWGPSMTDLAGKLQLKFLKFLLDLRKSTPSMMVFGEVGKSPIEVDVKCRVLSYWFKLRSPDNISKLSSVAYRFLFLLHKQGKYDSTYILAVKNMLIDIGMSGLWLNQETERCSPIWFKEKVKRSLLDNFIQQWYSSIDKNSIYSNYRMFKTLYKYEPYLTILPVILAKRLVKFRTTNNNLPVNILRFENTPRNERLCSKCSLNDIGDEFHYILCCPHFTQQRKQCIPRYYFTRPNTIKFHQLFSTTSKKKLLQLAHFVSIIQKELV